MRRRSRWRPRWASCPTAPSAAIARPHRLARSRATAGRIRVRVQYGEPMGRELVALGLAFLLAGFLGGAGRRVGLPTIPLFMLAGILVGPFTPGPVLFGHPEDLELLAA